MIETNYSGVDTNLQNTIAGALDKYRKSQGTFVRVPSSASFSLQIMRSTFNGRDVILMSACRYGMAGNNTPYRVTLRETCVGWAALAVTPTKDGENPAFSLVRKRLDKAIDASVRRVLLRSLFPGEVVLWCLLLMRKTVYTAGDVRDVVAKLAA